jgi:uncharacterized protein YecE (DUF72 family)
VSLYVGTSGWDYSEWRGHFYPAELPRARFLEHYSRTLNACELNATFYGRQTEKSVARWASSTPEHFRFCAKAHMRITYAKRLIPDSDARAFINEFVTTLAGLGDKLAVILLQFPPFRERDDPAFKEFLEALPSNYRYAFEFRHASWNAPEINKMLEEADAGVCFADESPDPPERLPDGPFAYVRLRSTNYTDRQRSGWSRLLQEEGRERDVFVFARHKGIDPAESSAGIRLASRLAAQLGS